MNKILLLIIICIIIYIIFYQKKIQFLSNYINDKSNIEKYCNNGSTNIKIQIPKSQSGIKIVYWTVSESSSNFNNSGIANINNSIANINIQCVDNNNNTYIYFRVVKEDDTLSQIYNQKINIL
jgi:predicted carbohydrate-binding protein with CBM5 and CBM33 domain